MNYHLSVSSVVTGNVITSAVISPFALAGALAGAASGPDTSSTMNEGIQNCCVVNTNVGFYCVHNAGAYFDEAPQAIIDSLTIMMENNKVFREGTSVMMTSGEIEFSDLLEELKLDRTVKTTYTDDAGTLAKYENLKNHKATLIKVIPHYDYAIKVLQLQKDKAALKPFEGNKRMEIQKKIDTYMEVFGDEEFDVAKVKDVEPQIAELQKQIDEIRQSALQKTKSN